MTSPASKHVSIPDAEQRLGKIWLGVRDRLEQRPSMWRRAFLWRSAYPWVAAGALASAAAVAIIIGWPEGTTTTSGWERATLQTASDGLDVDLQDGSRLELARETRLFLAEAAATAVEIQLEHGRVACDVVPNPARRFSVSTRGIEVRVTGTRFSVERSSDGHRVTVNVERGSVEVFLDGRELRKLGAGETWSLDERELAAANAATSNAATKVDGAPSAEELSTAPRQAPNEPSSREPTPPTAKGDEALAEALTAKDLLERANQLRRAGDVAGAARDYQRILEQFPGDGRAGLSAFELGRLRMDRLGDLPGAVQALKQAVTLAPGSGFREDAMARLVRAYDSMGQRGSCQRARQQYLSAFPAGVHASQLQNACE
jgi:tetratricopeptide (TPR) repeat protein